MFDAVVVGARCAGAPTAMHLAGRGRRVLLVDRVAFPSDTVSTHFITKSGVAFLNAWGLLDQVVATGSPPITRMTSDWGDFTLVGQPPPVEGAPAAYAPRRPILDKLLVDAAVQAGAELRQRTSLEELLWEDGRVVGARLREGGGRSYVERARIVIGADGRNSAVARLVGAPKYDDTPPLACQWYAYWEGIQTPNTLEAYRRGRVMMFAIPTDANLTCVITAMPRDRFDAFRTDVAGNYHRLLDQIPLGQRVRAARREGPMFGTGDLANFFRRAAGLGWALVGDAGYHKDPLTAQGIFDAFRDAERLTEAIDDGLASRRPLDAALAEYVLGRDEQVRELYEHTCKVAALPEPTEADFRLRAALRKSPDDVDRYFGVGDGTVSPTWFFGPENVRRIMEKAGMGEPAPAT